MQEESHNYNNFIIFFYKVFLSHELKLYSKFINQILYSLINLILHELILKMNYTFINNNNKNNNITYNE